MKKDMSHIIKHRDSDLNMLSFHYHLSPLAITVQAPSLLAKGQVVGVETHIIIWALATPPKPTERYGGENSQELCP